MKTRVAIVKAENGYFLQDVSDYWSAYGSPRIFATFEDAISAMAADLGEESFSATIKETTAMASALSQFVGAVLKPQLLAIEAKVTPGIENVVDDDIPL